MTAALRCRRCDDLHILRADRLCIACADAVDREFEASHPPCAACGDWDETVADVRVTPVVTVKLCAACAATPAVLVGIAKEA